MRTLSTRSRLVIAIPVALLIAVGLALLPRGRTAGPAGPRGGGSAFPLVPGSSRAYALNFSTTVSSAGGAPRETVLEGRLNVRVVAGAGGGSALAVQLAPLRVLVDGEPQPAMERRWAAPFVVAIGTRGALGASLFPPELAPGDRAVLDGAIRAFQVVLPAEPRDAWEETESDQVGTFVASYRRGGPGVVEKKKARYTSVRPPALVFPQVLASVLRAELDGAGPWLARAEGSERLRFAPEGGPPLATVEARFGLEPAGAPEASAAVWRDEAVRAARVGVNAPGPASSAWDDAEREATRQRLEERRVTIDQLVARARTSRGPDPALAHELAAYLRIFPEAAARFPDFVRGADDSTAQLLLHALELAGTPESQDALADVAESSGQSRDDRMRALVALGGVQAPTAGTLERLERDARAAGSGDRSGIASTALLALGAATANATAEAGERVVRDLAADLRGTRDSERQRLLLLALENAHAALPPEALAPHLASPDARVREVAARVAGAAEGGDPTGDLLAALAREPNAQVRAEMVGGLLARPADARANATIASALVEGREPAAAVRVRMVAYLARQIPVFPANRDVLRACLPRERDRSVTVAILNALAG